MKIIDEKGKIFGKLNIIDLLVLLLAVALIAVVAIKFGGGSGSGGTAQAVSGLVTYTVEVRGVEPEVYNSICEYVNLTQNKKDQLMADGKMISDANVIDVSATKYVPYGEDALVAGGTNDDRLTLVFTIQASVADVTSNKIGTQEVRIGKSHIVKTSHFECDSGTILTCVWNDETN